MTTTGRLQQRYDHRLRDLVHGTGDMTIVTDLGVPRSTARGWLGKAVLSQNSDGQRYVANELRIAGDANHGTPDDDAHARISGQLVPEPLGIALAKVPRRQFRVLEFAQLSPRTFR